MIGAAAVCTGLGGGLLLAGVLAGIAFAGALRLLTSGPNSEAPPTRARREGASTSTEVER